MKQFSKDLGNVSLAPKGKWSKEQEYERLNLVYNTCDNLSYVAKIDVPIGVEIDNREYWQPMNATGYADNNFINLTTENENGTITAYETLEEAVSTILPINRRAGATLSFYNLNSDRLDRQAEFELWQFNSTDLANWENRDYWNNIYYNWNVFAGWYIGADALKNHVKIPNVGQYAYVGTNLNDALLYQCRTNGTWTNTGIKVRNYISVVVSGNITIGENGNWFSNGEDTGIPATPDVDEQLDNIIMRLQQHDDEISNLKKSDANLQDQITSNYNDITNLNTKHESLSKTVQGIAATGGASIATNVTYNNNTSGLNAENAQDAIDELQGSKIDKTSILQESGNAEDKVMSQKAVSDKLSDLFKSVAYASHFYKLKGNPIVNYQSKFLPNVPYRLLVKNIDRDTNNNTVDCRIYVSLCNDNVDVKKITDTTSKDNSDIIVDFQLTEQEASSINSVRLYSSRGNTVFDVVIFEKTTEIINRIEQNNEKIKDLEAISTLRLYEETNINGASIKFVPIQLQTGLTYEFKFVANNGGVSIKTVNSESSSDTAEIISPGLKANSTINFTPSKQSKYILISTNDNVVDGELYINNLYSNFSLKKDIVNNKQMLLDKAAFYTKNVFVSSSYPENTGYLQDVYLSVNKLYIFNVNILNNPRKITVLFQIIYADNSTEYSPSYSESFTYKLTPEKDVKKVNLIVLAKNATSVSDTLELEYYLIESTNYIDYSINKLKEEVSEDIKETASILNQLLLIPSKKRCITGNVAIKERMQASMNVSKSFSPCIDYRGQLCFEEFTNLYDFNSNSSVLFAEQITTTGWDYDSKIRSWISLDEKNFTNYTTEKGLQEYVDGEKINYVSSVWNHACNDNNLHLIMVYFVHEDNRNFKSIFWSLDGGRTYEPAVNNFRGHFEITAEELSTAQSIEIDGKTYHIVSANEAQTSLKSNFNIYDDSQKLIEAAKNYLEDKIIVSNNKQDCLRFCAEKLISNGYYVRLNENNLIVYNKVIGTSGNGTSRIKVANVGKIFESGEDMSLSEAAKKSGIFYPTNIKYAKTEDEIPYSDFADISSILYINKEWYFFFDCQKNTTGIFANLCLKISNIENIETSPYRYTVIRNSGDLIYCEPCATFDKINNRIYVGMRSQVNYPILSYYSDDLGQTFKGYAIPNTSLRVMQGNAYIFRVFNPTLVYKDFFNHGYDRPISTNSNFTMLVCCVFSRSVGVVFTTTATVDYGWDGNMENLKWSEWKPLNHINDDKSPNFGGFEYKGCYFEDAGFASVGSLCYSRRYRGLIVGYQGLDVVNKKISYTTSIAKEPC